jgi:hypothetical protein
MKTHERRDDYKVIMDHRRRKKSGNAESRRARELMRLAVEDMLKSIAHSRALDGSRDVRRHHVEAQKLGRIYYE